MPPDKTKEPMRRKKYTDDDMHRAILAVRSGESIAGAARQFGIPRVTLMDKLSGRTSEMCKMGRKPVVGEEEELVLVRWILQCRSSGFPISIDQLIHSTKQMLEKLGKADVFPKGAPTKRWVEGFLKRHPELSLRECQNLTSTRANVTIENVEQWFKEVKTYLENNNLLEILQDPSRVFNCDETAFFLCPDKGKVIVGRGDKAVYRVSGNNEKENVTVLLNCAADGTLAPSMVVFPYDRWPPKVIASIPDEWGAGKTENGWMTAQSFYEYIGNVFDPYLEKLQIKRPVILFMDGHTSHMSLEVSELCSSKHIVLVALFPNATHILQPLDVAVFHPLKSAWRQAVTKWRFENGGRKVKNEDFAPLAKSVLDSGAVKPETIKNGFKSCGLLSLDPKKANLTKILGQPSGSKVAAAKTLNILTLQRHLYFLESRIDSQSLSSFLKEDTISVEDTSLFKLWKALKNEIANQKSPPERLDEPITNEEPPNLVNVSEPSVEGSTTGNNITDEEEVFLFEKPIVVTIPPDPNLSNESLLPISIEGLDSIEGINLQDLTVGNSSFNIDQPSCSWDIPFWNPEEHNQLIASNTATPSSKMSANNETPSRGIPAEEHPQFENVVTSTPSNVCEAAVTNKPPTDIPSPFKECLMWPTEKIKVNSKRKKIRTPSVVTSKLWKEYHIKIKEEKTKKEQAILERKQKREDKIKIKIEQSENKTKRKLTQTSTPSTKKNKADITEEETLDEFEEISFDLDKSCETPRLPEHFKIGLWVVVPYTKKKGGCEKFVGQILSINDEELSAVIKFLSKKGDKFVWPSNDDIDIVPLQDVVTTLDEPLFDRRGYLTFVNTMK